MIHTTQDKLRQSLKETDDLYYKLVLLVGEAGSGKTTLLKDVAEELGIPVINVNLKLSEQLLELTMKQRSLRLSQILDDIVDDEHSIKILDNIEILFDKGLKQDPLRILQKLSRKYIFIASWTGHSEDGKLIYAEPGHPEYKNYDSEDILIVNMDKTKTEDLIKLTYRQDKI
ncbi:MAG: BREX-3 system P-loop-containing protein BrxF [Methanomethylovorans sp.]|uniref:BREX-3 system P-loop-containing protein BrxF n=1 Tax=Methanomethylovorans sp. TaxID=2758717 RepID=UPI0035316EB0